MMRTLLTLLALTLPATAQQAVESPRVSESVVVEQRNEQRPVIRIGVRKSARPFSYGTGTEYSARILGPKLGPLRASGYDGYIVYICDEVLKQMMLSPTGKQTLDKEQIEVFDIDNEMQGREGEDRINLLEGVVDILCDPATVNRERVRRFAVSLPLFATSVGFLRSEELAFSPCNINKALIGAVGTTNAVSHGVSVILSQGEWKQRDQHDEIVKALQGPDGGTEECPHISNEVSGIIWTGRTHDEVASQFCKGNLYYYVGDLEIISQHAGRIPGCKFTASSKNFTNDRYAIYASISYRDEQKALLLGRFFEILNRDIITSDSLLDRAYFSEFGVRPQSPKLEGFFWSMRGDP